MAQVLKVLSIQRERIFYSFQYMGIDFDLFFLYFRKSKVSSIFQPEWRVVLDIWPGHTKEFVLDE